MQLIDLVERAEKLYRDRGSDAGLGALEAYSKGQVASLADLDQAIGELESTVPPFHPLISVVADSPAQIRAQDVYRLLSLSADREGLGAHLIALRPDLKVEVAGCLEELMEGL